MPLKSKPKMASTLRFPLGRNPVRTSKTIKLCRPFIQLLILDVSLIFCNFCVAPLLATYSTCTGKSIMPLVNECESNC